MVSEAHEEGGNPMIQSKNAGATAGYRLERIYVGEQHYEQVAPNGLREASNLEDRNVGFRCDWRPLGPRRFEVLLELELEATSRAPERARVRLNGVFEAVGDDQGIDLVTFLRTNAPAILFPFCREVLSTMTGRGLNGAFHLNPVNIAALLADFDFSQTTGYQYLEANPAIAETFGLAFRPALAAVR